MARPLFFGGNFECENARQLFLFWGSKNYILLLVEFEIISIIEIIFSGIVFEAGLPAAGFIRIRRGRRAIWGIQGSGGRGRAQWGLGAAPENGAVGPGYGTEGAGARQTDPRPGS